MTAPLPNCGHCGRFTVPVDSYAPWGGYADLEPPDPVLLCARCTDEEYRASLRNVLLRGLVPLHARGNWQAGGYYYQARAVARAMFRHGLAERPQLHMRARHETSGTRQVWVCQCGRPERHPAHDAKDSHRLGVQFCRFERRHAFTLGTFKVQEWCTCGWTSGARVPDDGVDYLFAGRRLREHIAAHPSEDAHDVRVGALR